MVKKSLIFAMRRALDSSLIVFAERIVAQAMLSVTTWSKGDELADAVAHLGPSGGLSEPCKSKLLEHLKASVTTPPKGEMNEPTPPKESERRESPRSTPPKKSERVDSP